MCICHIVSEYKNNLFLSQIKVLFENSVHLSHSFRIESGSRLVTASTAAPPCGAYRPLSPAPDSVGGHQPPQMRRRAPPLTHSCYTSDTARSAHRRLFEKRFANQKKVVTLSPRNRFALHGVRLKGNAVRIGDSTRCCDSRRTWATISHCKPSERLREGSPTGRDKSEDLPVSEKLHIDAFGS